MSVIAVFAIAMAACEFLEQVREPIMMFLNSLGSV